MTPVVALVGRPNVGKSTLFNLLTRTRRALVADIPGLTRDRLYGSAVLGGRDVVVVDTGGLTDTGAPLEAQMAVQIGAAIAEADVVAVVVDAREGLVPADQAAIDRLRRSGKPFRILVNKTDGLDPDVAAAEFHGLAAAPAVPIAAAHGRGLGRLAQALSPLLPAAPATGPPTVPEAATRIAIVGRPNVGKSTLVNRLLGEARVLTQEEPGTTRDAVEIPFARDGRGYVLVDTAGLRRRARTTGTVEKFSALKTLEAIRAAHVAILLLDARQGIAVQDQHIVGHVLDAGCALVAAVNKWDGLDPETRARVRSEYGRRFVFLDFAETHYISALHGTGVGELLGAAERARAAATRDLPTHELTRVLEDAVAAHQPPVASGGRIKLRYAHQGGSSPPRIVVHGSRVRRLPVSYRRYLEHRFREAFDLRGTPLRLEFRGGAGGGRSAGRHGARRKRRA